MEYDEDKAAALMLQKLKKSAEDNRYSTDDMLEIIDAIYDYYEDHGNLEVEMDAEDSDDDIEDLINSVARTLVKPGRPYSRNDIAQAVREEIKYELSLI
ncbi:MAG: hypothetical protein K2M79_03930 [Muribaculaceae bacterium]|nr:hypothetical protein [Muribaculaceae bacterium]